MPSWADPEIWAASLSFAEKEGQLENFFRAVETGSFKSNAGLLDQLFRRRTRRNWNDWSERFKRMFDLMSGPEGWSGRQVADYFGLMNKGGITKSDGLKFLHANEAVIPLDRYVGPPARMGRSGGGGEVTINFQGPVYGGTPEQLSATLAPAMMEAIRREQRRGRPTITRTV